MAITVNATQFTRNFPRYRDSATEAGLVVVTNHEGVVGGYLSASELAHDQRLKARERKVYKTNDLPDDLIAALEAAEYDVAPA